MKVVFQIAGGIVLAFLVIIVIVGISTEYQLQQVYKEIEISQKERSARNAKNRLELFRKREAERLASLERKNKGKPVSQVSWTVELNDGSAVARQQYLSGQQKNGYSVYKSKPATYSGDSPKITKSQEVIQQLIKKNNGFK